MPLIAGTGAMLLCGHESATVKSALACRTQSPITAADRATIRQFLSPVTAVTP